MICRSLYRTLRGPCAHGREITVSEYDLVDTADGGDIKSQEYEARHLDGTMCSAWSIYKMEEAG